MKNVTNKCIKCSSDSYELKTLAIPLKDTGSVKFAIDIFYLKICNNCGYTEMYSAKVVDKDEETVLEY